jgi:CBS domain-containing protein
MRNVTIARVMTPAPATVPPTASVAEAERLMRERQCHHVPVVAARKVVGMLATHDLMKALVLRPDAGDAETELLRRSYLENLHVEDVMQRNVRVLTETATLLDAARALGTGALHALPVVAADGHLVGIVTSSDVIQALADDLEHGVGDRAARPTTPTPSMADVADPQVRALRDVYRAVRNYLSSGQAEVEHTRLVQAADRARDALRSAGIELSR